MLGGWGSPMGTSHRSALKWLGLVLLLFRPFQRFLADCIAVSTQPSAFFRERIHLGDTTSFFRAGNFFLFAISAAFLAEIATLSLFGISGATEPYYWLVAVLFSIPFVLICFLLVRLVVPLSLKDVVHISAYPIGAGMFAGAFLALLAATAVAALEASGFISEITVSPATMLQEVAADDYWQLMEINCLKEQSLAITIIASGMGDGYDNLKNPFDELSHIRPVVTVLYLLIAARLFMTATDSRKFLTFGAVLLAAVLGAASIEFGLREYMQHLAEKTGCSDDVVVAAGLYQAGPHALKEFADDLNADFQKDASEDDVYDILVSANGRNLIYKYLWKEPILDMTAFHRGVAEDKKTFSKDRCSSDYLLNIGAREEHHYYSSDGEWLASFVIDRSDCPQ